MAVLLPPKELRLLIESAPHRYKVYAIPKRTPGQVRVIAQPAKEVKALQYWVMKHVLSQFELHRSATAYREKLSILDNALPHASGRYLLKMDFKDFFPSLRAEDFRIFLKRRASVLDANEIGALCSILFWMPKDRTPDLCLSIGAPSSPTLSNILMADFDRQVTSFCNARNVVYTRYADDLSFSAATSDRLQVVEKAIIGWCSRSKSPQLSILLFNSPSVRLANAPAVPSIMRWRRAARYSGSSTICAAAS